MKKFRILLKFLKTNTSLAAESLERVFAKGKDYFFSDEFEAHLDALISFKLDKDSKLHQELNRGDIHHRVLKKLAYVAKSYSTEILGLLAGVTISPKLGAALALVVIALIAFNLLRPDHDPELT